ncbi:MAG: nitroreductase [uncultured bacterium]|nr:MAG: nitroreductase [uncultured bacterium]
MIAYEDILKSRRSIRDYEDKTISPELLQKILTDACQAPSATNLQPWRFIVIQDRKLMQRISDESKKNLLREIEANPNSHQKQYEKMLHDRPNLFYNAPCLVIIAGKNENEYFHRDCALAAAYFMFAATAKNLGTCWVGLGSKIEDAALRKEIGLPEDYEIVATLTVGYPHTIPAASPRQPKILKMILGD